MATFDELKAKLRRLCESGEWSELELAIENLPLALAVEVSQLLTNYQASEFAQFKHLSWLKKAAGIVTFVPVIDFSKFGDANSPSKLLSFELKPAAVSPAASISKNGAYIALPIGETIRLLETSSCKEIGSIELEGICIGTALSNSGKILLSVEQSKSEANKITPVLYETHTGKKLAALSLPKALDTEFSRSLVWATLLMTLYTRSALPVSFAEDDRLLLMQAKGKLQVYDCSDGELIHQFPIPETSIQAPVIADKHIVIADRNSIGFYKMPFGDVELEVGIKGQFINYAGGIILSSSDQSVNVADKSGKVVRSFKASNSKANFESSPDCRFVCDRLQSAGRLQFFKSIDGTKTDFQLVAGDQKSEDGYALLMAGATGLGIVAPDSLWFCPYEIRASSSEWKPAVLGLAHKLVKDCTEIESKTIDQILQRASFSAAEENLLKLMQSVLKTQSEPESGPGADSGVIVSLSTGKVISKIGEGSFSETGDIDSTSSRSTDEPNESGESASQDGMKINDSVSSQPAALFERPEKIPSRAELIELLARNPEENEVWHWLPFVSALSARDILKYLRKCEWQPDPEMHLKVFNELQKLARNCRSDINQAPAEVASAQLVCRTDDSIDIDNAHDAIPVARILCESSGNWLITFALSGDRFPARLWSLKDGKTHRHLTLSTGIDFVLGMGLNQQGNLLAVEYCSRIADGPPVPGVDKARIAIYSIPEMEFVKLLDPEQELLGVHSPIFSPDSKSMYAVNARSIRVWDTQTWTLKETIPILPKSAGADAFIYDLSVDFDSKHFAVIVSSYDASSFSVQLRSLMDGSLISTAYLPPSSSRLAGANLLKESVLTISGPQLALWKLPKLQNSSNWIPPGFSDGQYAARAVSPDGDLLAIARVNERMRKSVHPQNSEIHIVRLPEWKVVDTLVGPISDVLCLAFSARGDKLYAGTWNGVWEFCAPLSCDPRWNEQLEQLANKEIPALTDAEYQQLITTINCSWLKEEQKSWIKLIVALKELAEVKHG